MARTTQRCSNHSLLNFNKATKSIGGIREDEQIGGGTHEISPRSRSSEFPSQREGFDWSIYIYI
jgi:hypothetical protein